MANFSFLTPNSSSSVSDTSNPQNCSLILNDYCESVEDYVSRIREYLRFTAFTWILAILYIIVFIVGVCGNFLVCLIVLKNKHMRSVTNVFIVNLAFSDLLVLLLCLPMTVVEDILKTWFFGDTTCKIVKCFQHISVIMSILTLTVISIERWYVILYPLRFTSSIKRACIAIISIWISSTLVGIPQAFSMAVVHFNKVPSDVYWLTECISIWETNVIMSIKLVELTILFVVPVIWMVIAYAMITEKLWFRQSIINSASMKTNSRDKTTRNPHQKAANNQLRSRRKVCVMLIIMVAMFIFCYLPVHLIQIIRLFVSKSFLETRPMFAQFFNKCGILSHWLCHFNSAINPVIYTFMSTKFTRELKRMFCHCNLHSLPNESPSIEYNTLFLRPNRNHRTDQC